MANAAVNALKNQLVRRASRAIVGGFRPSNDPLASWFGKVNVALPDEDWPTSAGRPMMPLCQFNLAEMPFRPEALSDVALLTVFIDQENLPIDVPNGDGWLLRTYSSLDRVVALEQPADHGYLKPFPIRWELIAEDYPCWEDACEVRMPSSVEDNFHDFFENENGTKIGGWPSLIQAGLGMASAQETLNYSTSANPAIATSERRRSEYVFQIDTEPKALWGWGDGGVGYIGRGTGTARDVWTLEWQCY